MTADRLAGWRDAAAWLRDLAEHIDLSVPAGDELRAPCVEMVKHYKLAAASLETEADRLAAGAARHVHNFTPGPDGAHRCAECEAPRNEATL